MIKNLKIIYDFDGTLTKTSLPEFKIFPSSSILKKAPNQKIVRFIDRGTRKIGINLYQVLFIAYLDILKLKRKMLAQEISTIEQEKINYCAGVSQFLETVKSHGVSNYLVSTNLEEQLEKTIIAPLFDKIYGTVIDRDEKDKITNIEVMDELKKIETVKQITKNANDCSDVIYFGDGLTDEGPMKYIKNHGGTSILVYQDATSKIINDFSKRDIVTHCFEADYRPNSNLNNYIHSLVKK